MKKYEKTFEVRWDDIDANRHVANISYNKFATHVRFCFLQDNGFTQQDFVKHGIGPAILEETFQYRKELEPFETVRVDVQMLGLSSDNRFGRFVHHIYKHNGDVAGIAIVTFAWISLTTRKIIVPPAELIATFSSIPKSKDFAVLTKQDVFGS